MDYKDFAASMRTMSREELEAYIAEQEAPLIERLNELNDYASHAVRGEKIAIRDERVALSDLQQMWLRLNRPDDAGPDQVIAGPGA